MRKFLALFFVFVVTISLCKAANDVPRMKGFKFLTAPNVDGQMSEGEWGAASYAKGFLDPFTGQAPAEDTEVWLGYTDEAIFVAFRAYDSDISKIVARSIQPGTVPGTRRGGGGGSSITEDVLEFSIDTFNSRQGSMSDFRVNALGTTSENIAGGRASKREFRGEWTAAAKIVNDGWIVEMRIPWAILNLPNGSLLSMDINFSRANARTQITSSWANTTLRRLPEYLGVWSEINPPKQKSSDKLHLMAYVAPEYDEDAANEFDLRMGVDARYAFNSQLSGLVSINPDFKNIEQEVSSISFTRSSRFEFDNRPFFTEGANFFGRNSGGMGDQLFYSRAITDFDEGAKFYGMLDKKSSIGALVTREDGRRTDGVMNYSQVVGPRSTLGFFASQSSSDVLENKVYGANARMGTGNFNLGGQYNVADDSGNADTAGNFNVGYNIPRFSSSINYSWVEPDYRPELGFIEFQDKRGMSFFMFHNAQYQSGNVRSLNAFLFAGNYETYDNHNQDRGLDFEVNLTTRSDISYRLGGATWRYLNEEENTVTLGADFNVSNRFNTFGFNFNHGSRDRELTEYLDARGNYRLQNGIDLGLSHSFLNFQGRTEQSIFTVGWEVDKKQSLAGRVVRSDDEYNYYVSYSSSGFTGLDWFLIIGDPNATAYRNRASLKFVWAR